MNQTSSSGGLIKTKIFMGVFDPRLSSPPPPPPPPQSSVLKTTTSMWLSKPKENKNSTRRRRTYTIERPYKGPQPVNKFLITTCVEEKLILEPNTQHFPLKLERNENDIAINKALAPLTTPLKKIAENTSPSPKKRQKIYAESSPSPSSTLNVKSKAESIDTVKEEEKEGEINKSASFLNQQQHQQPVQQQQQLLPQQSSDDDENNYDDAIGFDKSADERNLQTFLTTYPAPIQPYIYAFLKESSQINKYY
ncbi:hypothetical protein ABEB36_004606 [Hypothenemus hampei]|uniref:Uncharacterized protein n=1 Tax=Hypothenemus hampei TaxID=57062 RepID=A0ABD1F3V9_HYPHA